MGSNRAHIDHALELVVHSGRRKIGMVGLSFKPGTDDLRESPLVTVAERLIGKGYDLRIYDPDVNPTYQDITAHYGTVVLPARSGHARDKAKVEAACRRAFTFKIYSYKGVANILKTQADKLEVNNHAPAAPPVVHENIRGPGYYH